MDPTGVLEVGFTILRGFSWAERCYIGAPQVWVPVMMGICAPPVVLTSVGGHTDGLQT